MTVKGLELSETEVHPQEDLQGEPEADQLLDEGVWDWLCYGKKFWL